MLCRFFLFGLMMCMPWRQATAQLTYANLLVQYDSAWQCDGWQLVPIRYRHNVALRAPVAAGASVTSLQKALATHKARAREVYYESGASVGLLQVSNLGKEALFIGSGELLAGGKQDRVVAESKLIMPGETDFVQVYCVEKGRWADKALPFTHAGMADGGLRRVMDVVRRQADVWKEIEYRFGSSHQPTTTWPYLRLPQRLAPADSLCYRQLLERFTRSDSLFAGFAAVHHGQVVACEVFADSRLTSLAFAGMLQSWLAFTHSPPPSPGTNAGALQAFLDQLLQSELSQKTLLETHGIAHQVHGQTFHVVAWGP